MIVREKCAQIEIQRTLKKQDFGFCKKVIYTPYEYRESIESKKKNMQKEIETLKNILGVEPLEEENSSEKAFHIKGT